MNQPLYIAAIAALFFVLLSKHLHHIYEVGTEAWFKTFKQNYDKTEWRNAHRDYPLYFISLWALTGITGTLMITYLAIWFKQTQL